MTNPSEPTGQQPDNVCDNCQGYGEDPFTHESCHLCKGKGRVKYGVYIQNGACLYDNHKLKVLTTSQVRDTLQQQTDEISRLEKLLEEDADVMASDQGEIQQLRAEVERLKQQIAEHQAINSLIAGDEPEVKLANQVFSQAEEIKRLKEALQVINDMELPLTINDALSMQRIAKTALNGKA